MLKMRIFVLICLFFLLVSEKSRGDEDASGLAVIQPGRPGSPRAAEGFLLRLGNYLATSTNLPKPALSYQNDPAEALKELDKQLPAVGIVSLGFYLEYADRFGMRPLLEAYPLEKYVLVASEGTVKKAADLDGKVVMGGPFHEPKFVSRILFPPKAKATAALAGWKGTGSWVPKPTTKVSSALYQLGKNRVQAVLLHGNQYESMKKLGRLKKVEKVIESEYYPPAVIVAFRGALKSTEAVSEEQRLLMNAMEKISTVKEAREIVQQMGCQGFRKIRPGWMGEIEKKYLFERGEKNEK